MQTLKLADHLLISIKKGSKKLTIRRGRRDIQRGKLKFETVSGNDEIEVKVVDVKYTKIANISDDICKEDGFKNWIDFYEGMKKYYPDLDISEECTIIKFKL